MFFFNKDPKKIIYIVDDESDIRDFYKHLLKKLGNYEIVQFTNVAEIKKRISEDKVLPVLSISDIKMPGESGLTLKGYLENNNMKVPLILITALSGEGDVRLGYTILNKPINIEIFNREVKKALKLEIAD